jgi:ferritin
MYALPTPAPVLERRSRHLRQLTRYATSRGLTTNEEVVNTSAHRYGEILELFKTYYLQITPRFRKGKANI